MPLLTERMENRGGVSGTYLVRSKRRYGCEQYAEGEGLNAYIGGELVR